MGRGKIEIKRIENSTNRQVTYSKRRNGLLKKAKEITVLCDSDVSLVIFSATGKMSEYCSSSTTLIKMLDRYQKASGNRLWDAKHEYLSMEIDRIKKENDTMQIELRHLKGEDLTSLHPKELIHIEDALENGLTGVRDKQEELLSILKKNGRILEEENMRLTYMLMEMLEMWSRVVSRKKEIVLPRCSLPFVFNRSSPICKTNDTLLIHSPNFSVNSCFTS